MGARQEREKGRDGGRASARGSPRPGRAYPAPRGPSTIATAASHKGPGPPCPARRGGGAAGRGQTLHPPRCSPRRPGPPPPPGPQRPPPSRRRQRPPPLGRSAPSRRGGGSAPPRRGREPGGRDRSPQDSSRPQQPAGPRAPGDPWPGLTSHPRAVLAAAGKFSTPSILVFLKCSHPGTWTSEKPYPDATLILYPDLCLLASEASQNFHFVVLQKRGGKSKIIRLIYVPPRL